MKGKALFALLFYRQAMKDKIEVLGSPVTYTEQKPRPHNPLNRPKISYVKPVVCLLTFIAGIVLILCLWPEGIWVRTWMAILFFCLLYAVIFSRKAVIWFVHLYQNKASDQVRLRCVFEPSCSEYMILAVKKYGALIGVCKGIGRLKRCHPPNGGEDYP